MMELKWYKGVSKGVAPHGTQDPSSSISSLTQGLSPRYPTSIQGQPQSTREKLAFPVGRVSLTLRPLPSQSFHVGQAVAIRRVGKGTSISVQNLGYIVKQNTWILTQA